MADCMDPDVMSEVQDDATETPVALLRKEFNRNRKIVLKNVPGIIVEVVKSDSLFVGSVYFAECGLRNAEFEQRIICGNFDAECSANYTLFEFRIPQNTVSRYARQNRIVINRTL